MPIPNRPLSQNKYSEQNMGNTSFDEDFGVNAVEVLGFETVGGTLNRLSVDTNGKLNVNATVNVTSGPIADGVDANIKATVKDLINSNPLVTALVDANGDQITSFGGGTQYTEGDTDVSITGTASMMEVAANTLQPIQGTVADGLLVNLGTNNDISGAVTANAGTNLNTSALALETGGNLATIAGKDFATQTTLALIKAKTDNIPALGQALAAASVPVVLPTATITTLTPPAAITGFALETGGNLATLAGAVSATHMQVDVLTAPTTAVTGTFYQATQPVSGTVAVTNAGITTIAGAVAGTEMQVDVITMPTVAVTGTFYQATQPVSLETVPSHAVTNAGTFATQETAATTIYNGKKTVTTAGTRVTLAASQAVKSVTIKALIANTGIIYIGDGTVAAANGYALSAGDTISLDIGNLATVNLDASVSGESCTFIGIL